AFQRNHRREDFLAVYLHIRTRARQHRRFENCTSALAAAKQSRSILNRSCDPFFGTNRIPFANQRTEVSSLVHRIANTKFAHACQQQIAKFGERRTLRQNALDRDASLARISKAPGNAALGRPGEIGIAVNYHARIATQLKHNLLLARAALEVPPNRRAASKAD